jgi:catechol 2,3-dioxygenase-like lactoylglutathione lyase family enzyme
MKPRINIITLGVRDLEHAIEFYEQGLRLPRMPFEGNIAFFELNGTWLALYPWNALAEDAEVNAEGKGFRGVTLAQVVHTREEVDKVLRQAAHAGARIIKPAQDVFWGGYSGYFSDPEGHIWEVAWNPHFWPGPTDEE